MSVFVTYLDGVELTAFFCDLFGVIIGGLFDLQQPGCLSQRPQSVNSIRALEFLLFQPLFQIADVTSKTTEQLKN